MSLFGIAAEALQISVDAVTTIEPIKHGLTNESWLVRAGRDAVVVRISNTAESELQIDRNSEAVILSAVAAAGIGAQVLLNDPARRLLVTRYLGETWSYEKARSTEQIGRLAGLLSRLHRLAVPAGVRRVDLGETVEGYLDTLDRHGVRSGVADTSFRERARETARMLRESSAACLCHNDVHHLNIVGDSEPRLIDWEYAGVGEPMFDLASVCVYHQYDEKQREQLLCQYAPQGGDALRHRLDLCCWLFDYVRELWTAVRTVTDHASAPGSATSAS